MSTSNKFFDYSSEEQKELLQFLENQIGPNEINLIIRNGTIFDKSLMYISNAWTRHSHGTEEDRDRIHEMQTEIIKTTIGALANHLSDDEWDSWSEFANSELTHLRSFNGSFLGLLWHRKQISDDLADVLNVLAWHFDLYYIIANSAYKIIRPRAIEMKWSDAYVHSNGILTKLHFNMMNFITNFGIRNCHLEFIKSAMSVVRNQPQDTKKSWVLYYDNINHSEIDVLMNSEEFNIF